MPSCTRQPLVSCASVLHAATIHGMLASQPASQPATWSIQLAAYAALNTIECDVTAVDAITSAHANGAGIQRED
jgi:hypothetical protein